MHIDNSFCSNYQGINSPVTNYFENKIINVLTYNIDIRDFQKMDTFIQIDDENQKQIAISDDKGMTNIKDDIINDGAANYDYKNLS